MRSSYQGLWSTLAMFIPLLAVPFLAAIGIPQFTPTAASSEADTSAEPDFPPVELGVGESLHHGAEDLFAPFEREKAPADPPHEAPGQGWDDPFHSSSSGVTAESSARSPRPRTERPGARRFDETPPESSPWAEQDPVSEAPPFQDRAGGRPNESTGRGNGLLAFGVGDRVSQPNRAPESPHAQPQQPQSNPFDWPAERASVPASRSESPPGENSGDAAETLNWGAAVRRLNELGISDFQLAPGQRANQFLFACTYAPPEAPRIVHRFEAEAADPLAAVGEVLRQVEEWRSRR